MTKSDDALLGRELAKLGALGAKIGGTPGSELIANSMGSMLQRMAPTDHYQADLTLPLKPEAALTLAYDYVQSHGRPASGDAAGASEYPKISGIMGSGFLGMNPTVLHIELVANEGNSTHLLVSAAAKEGLIKQHAAEKAVTKAVDWLQQQAG